MIPPKKKSYVFLKEKRRRIELQCFELDCIAGTMQNHMDTYFDVNPKTDGK